MCSQTFYHEVQHHLTLLNKQLSYGIQKRHNTYNLISSSSSNESGDLISLGTFAQKYLIT